MPVPTFFLKVNVNSCCSFFSLFAYASTSPSTSSGQAQHKKRRKNQRRKKSPAVRITHRINSLLDCSPKVNLKRGPPRSKSKARKKGLLIQKARTKAEANPNPNHGSPTRAFGDNRQKRKQRQKQRQNELWVGMN